MSQSSIISIDLGYGYTKAKFKESYFRQQSIVGEPRDVLSESLRPTDICYDNKYFIGDLAARHSDIKYLSTKDEKFEVWTTKILFKSVLGFLSDSKDINIVTGLPIDFYFSQKTGFESLMSSINTDGPYTLQLGMSELRLCNPNITKWKIIPQHLGAAMDYLLDNEGKLTDAAIANKSTLVIDPGYYTLGLLALDGMEVTKLSASHPGLGVDSAYKVLQQYLRDKIGKAPDRVDMDKHILSRSFNTYDIGPLIDLAFKALASQIMIKIDSLNLRFDSYIITGGCGSFIYDYLDLSNKILLEDPQFGNVRGYSKIGVRLWGF